jgi:hypothetical protein
MASILPCPKQYGVDFAVFAGFKETTFKIVIKEEISTD